jgi:hypothetical protein
MIAGVRGRMGVCGGEPVEEQRISMMYVNLIKRWFEDVWDSMLGGHRRRRSLMPALVVLGVLAVSLAIYFMQKPQTP